MAFIKPFEGYLVKSEHAATIVSPAYDSVSPEQRRQFADANPDNFINTMRLREDFPEGKRPGIDELLQGNRSRLHRLLNKNAFLPPAQADLFIYQLGTDHHLQTGLVCEVSVEDYKNGRLRKHENTRANKEDLLTQYQSAVSAASSPICLTYPRNDDIDTCIAGLLRDKPELNFTTPDGEVQRIWRISNRQAQQQLQALFEGVAHTYVTDGHHRAAAGLRYSELMQAKHGTTASEFPHNRLLVVLFPDNQLNLLPFHRCVKDLNHLSVEELLKAVSEKFFVAKLKDSEVFEPTQHGEFGMLVRDEWYQLKRKPLEDNNSSPVSTLDVTVLQQDILDPILGINDIRDDDRLGYIAGVSGDEGILQASREGWAVIFTCYATSIRQLMDVADANELMPPKSTYFDPKPRSGIFIRLK